MHPCIALVLDDYRVAGHDRPRMCACLQMLASVPLGISSETEPEMVTCLSDQGAGTDGETLADARAANLPSLRRE